MTGLQTFLVGQAYRDDGDGDGEGLGEGDGLGDGDSEPLLKSPLASRPSERHQLRDVFRTCRIAFRPGRDSSHCSAATVI